MHKLRPGAVVSRRQLTTTRSQPVQLPDPTGVVHLQFRRYAGCPFCNLHLRSVASGTRRSRPPASAKSSCSSRRGQSSSPNRVRCRFAVIADPGRKLYAEFGVASSPRAVLDRRAWLAGVRAAARKRPSLPTNRHEALRLPADFLVAADGHVLACKYGVHAYDQWSVDDLLQLASRHLPATDHPVCR